MYLSASNAAIRSVKGQNDDAMPPLKLRSLMWRSALLNLAVVLTALPVMASAGGPKAVVPALGVLAAVSILIWVATFAIFSLWSITRIFIRLSLHRPRHPHESSYGVGSLADHYLDGPA